MPPLSTKFMEWNVKYVVFDSPTKAQIHYKDNTIANYVWDNTKKKWVNSLSVIKNKIQS